jgi:lipoate-protein ligase A
MSELLTVLPYDLPDADLLTSRDGQGRVCVFVPARVMVVIGKGSDPDLELRAEAIQSDGVPILQRGTGGCAVVLAPTMLVTSFALYETEQAKSADYFRDFNRMIIRTLENLGISDLEHAGISDIARHGRKIVGSALYRNRLTVFYHAVINLAGGTDLMERYLKHPPRTPDYRKNRSHVEFVTSLAAEGFAVEPEDFRKGIEAEFSNYLTRAHIA